MNRRRYWERIREVESRLPETVVLISQDVWGTGDGQGVEVTRTIAARDIVMGTHRLANEAETVAFYADQMQRREAALQRLAEARQQVVYMMHPPAVPSVETTQSKRKE